MFQQSKQGFLDAKDFFCFSYGIEYGWKGSWEDDDNRCIQLIRNMNILASKFPNQYLIFKEKYDKRRVF